MPLMPYDLFIVGAGPAGLTLAWKAAQQGLRVVVVDRKPSASHVAYLTSGTFMDVRDWDLPASLVHPTDAFYYASRHDAVVLPGKAGVINRRELLSCLAERAERCGAELRFSTRVADVRVARNRIEQVTVMSPAGAQEMRAVVYADSSGGRRALEQHLPIIRERRVVNSVGMEYLVPLKTEPRTIDLYIGRHCEAGYGWLCPMNERTAILGFGTLAPSGFPRVKATLDDLFDLPRVQQRVEHRILEAHGGVLRTGNPFTTLHRGNLLVLGDLAVQANPVIGEGIRFVMDAGRMASVAVAQAVATQDLSALQGYAAAWKKKYHRMFRAGNLLQRAIYYLTQSDFLCDQLVRRVRLKPPSPVPMQVLRGEVDYGFALRKAVKVGWYALMFIPRAIARRAQHGLRKAT